MCSMSFTVVVMPRSEIRIIRFSISSGVRPVYCQMTLTIGMSIGGKMSFAMRRADRVPMIRIRSATTVNV